MISAMNSALQGMQQNQLSFARHADRISRWGLENQTTDGPEATISLPQEMVGILQSRQGFVANLAVLKTSDEMLGSLLDVLA